MIARMSGSAEQEGNLEWQYAPGDLILMTHLEWKKEYMTGEGYNPCYHSWTRLYRRFVELGTPNDYKKLERVSAAKIGTWPTEYTGTTYDGKLTMYVLCRKKRGGKKHQFAGQLFAFLVITDATRKVGKSPKLPKHFSYLEAVGSQGGTQGMGKVIFNMWLEEREDAWKFTPVVLQVAKGNESLLRDKIYPKWNFERCDNFKDELPTNEEAKKFQSLLCSKDNLQMEMGEGEDKETLTIKRSDLQHYMVYIPGLRGAGGPVPRRSTRPTARVHPYMSSVVSMLDECDRLEALMDQLGFEIF